MKSNWSSYWILWFMTRSKGESSMIDYIKITSLLLVWLLFKYNWHLLLWFTQSYPTRCDPMDRSTPGLPALHCLPESTQTHVHGVSDSIQPSHPLSPPSPPALNFPSIRVFSNESALHIRWPKYWSFSFIISPSNEYSGLISFRMDWLSRVSSRTTVQEDPLEKEMAIHFSILTWSIPWTEEPGRLHSIGSHRVGHNWHTLWY